MGMVTFFRLQILLNLRLFFLANILSRQWVSVKDRCDPYHSFPYSLVDVLCRTPYMYLWPGCQIYQVTNLLAKMQSKYPNMLQKLEPNSFWFLWALFILASLNAVQRTNAEDIPPSKLSQNIGGPTLKFLYCYSCGYRKMFEEYVNILQQKYPYMAVDGKNYDPPGFNLFLSRLIGLVKMALICCILGGINIFQYINQQQPSWWSWCIENKIYACMMLFFLCNIVEGQLIHSGAFEISLNDVPVWSKLETGRIPQPAELFQIIDSHMQFTDRAVEINNGFAK